MHPGQSSEIQQVPIKQDYVWIPGDVDEELLGGNYHLSTKEAHREALRRINLQDKERKNSTLSNVINLKIRSKNEKEDDKLTKKAMQLLKSRLEESSSESRSDVIQKRRNSIAEERRRSSLRNSAATISSDISLMGYSS